MMRNRSMLLIAAMLVGCASSAAHVSSGKSARDDSQMTAEELGSYHFRTAYDLIRAKRPRWLQVHGPQTTTGANRKAYEVVVYVDGTRMGGPEALKRVYVGDLQDMQYLTAAEVMSRYGWNHSGGAIMLSTRRTP